MAGIACTRCGAVARRTGERWPERFPAPGTVQKIFEILRAVSKEGVILLLVEQNTKLARESCERGSVMESGRVTLAGRAQAPLGDPHVGQAYLGE